MTPWVYYCQEKQWRNGRSSYYSSISYPPLWPIGILRAVCWISPPSTWRVLWRIHKHQLCIHRELRNMFQNMSRYFWITPDAFWANFRLPRIKHPLCQIEAKFGMFDRQIWEEVGYSPIRDCGGLRTPHDCSHKCDFILTEQGLDLAFISTHFFNSVVREYSQQRQIHSSAVFVLCSAVPTWVHGACFCWEHIFCTSYNLSEVWLLTRPASMRSGYLCSSVTSSKGWHQNKMKGGTLYTGHVADNPPINLKELYWCCRQCHGILDRSISLRGRERHYWSITFCIRHWCAA